MPERKSLALLATWSCVLVLTSDSIARSADGPTDSAPAGLDPLHVERMAAGTELFKTRVREVLIKRCLDCHGGKKTRARFNLGTRESLLRGGAEGVAVVPGQHVESRLWRLITHAEEPHMPQRADKLADAEIAAVAEWIDHGAPYDAPLLDSAAPEQGAQGMEVSEADRDWWSFRPLGSSPPDATVDSFVRAGLEEAGLEPGPLAPPDVLLRRLSLVLTGLPPAPEELDRFLAKPDALAWSSRVDELLGSMRFGERWARHWLDVARFAESHGFEHDYDRKHAYHYRDFVIRALASDMPFDRFVHWQVAGDELAPEEPLALMATGFLGAGVFPTQITKREVERTRYDALDDMASTTASAFLGLTVGCARCHDHKFDPLPTVDYYRFVSTFTTTVRSEVEIDLAPEDRARALARHTETGRRLEDAHGAAPPKPRLEKVQITSEGVPPMRHHTQGADFFDKTWILERGDTEQKREVATQSFLRVLMTHEDGAAHWQLPAPESSRSSHRRAALARWLTDTEHGAGRLLARVAVNRIWQHHFGRGIVATPNDFGAQGSPPTHPELLDWLAGKLLESGWRTSTIHRLILHSHAWRQSSAHDAAKAAIDPSNRLLWRFTPRRLEAEAIRDTLLYVSGLLDESPYGPGTLDEGMRRRSIYFTMKRSRLVPILQLFDLPEPLVSQGARPSTTIAPQALLFLNNRHVRDWARALAEGARPRFANSAPDGVQALYRRLFTRAPQPEELAATILFLERQEASYRDSDLPTETAHLHALTDLAQALLGCNELIWME